jgi:hypothetical protein
MVVLTRWEVRFETIPFGVAVRSAGSSFTWAGAYVIVLPHSLICASSLFCIDILFCIESLKRFVDRDNLPFALGPIFNRVSQKNCT